MTNLTSRHIQEKVDWDTMTPVQVLSALVYELYNPVSQLSNQLNRLTGDEDPLTEDEYDNILEQMQKVVDQLSKKVVRLRQYVHEHTLCQEVHETKPEDVLKP